MCKQFSCNARIAASFHEFSVALISGFHEECAQVVKIFLGEQAAPAFISREYRSQVLFCLVQTHIFNLSHAFGLPLHGVKRDVARPAL